MKSRSEKDEDYGYTTMMHQLCWSSAITAEELRGRLATHPDEASQKNDLGFTPLHFLAMNTCLTVVMLELLLTANPEAASVRAEFKEQGVWNDYFTPLHLLCWKNTCLTVEILEVLLTANPEAASMRAQINYKENTPLDLLKFNKGATEEMKEMLVNRTTQLELY